MNTIANEMLMPNTFNTQGFTMRKVKETPSGYMYSKSWEGSNDIIGYEVFQRRISKENTSIVGGVKVLFKSKEMFPSNEAFGEWAWAYTKSSYDKAFNHVDGITMHTSMKDAYGIPLSEEEQSRRDKALVSAATRKNKKAAV